MTRERLTRRSPLFRPWTPEEDAVLLEMLRQGKQAGGIAVRLKRSISAIHTRRAMLHKAPLLQNGSALPCRPFEGSSETTFDFPCPSPYIRQGQEKG